MGLSPLASFQVTEEICTAGLEEPLKAARAPVDFWVFRRIRPKLRRQVFSFRLLWDPLTFFWCIRIKNIQCCLYDEDTIPVSLVLFEIWLSSPSPKTYFNWFEFYWEKFHLSNIFPSNFSSYSVLLLSLFKSLP